MILNTGEVRKFKFRLIKRIFYLFTFIVFTFSCHTNQDGLSNDNTISNFSIQSFKGTVTSTNDSINVIVPSGTNLNGVNATFTVSTKAVIKVDGITQISGKTLNDFSKSIIYMVTAEDGSIRKYVIKVSFGPLMLLNLDFDGSDFILYGSFDFTDNGYKKTGYNYNGTIEYVPTIRIEGSSISNTPRVTVVNSQLENSGNALQYTLGPQLSTDEKARVEHYLFIGDFKKAYVSEFSIKLHPNFTPIDLVRLDGGVAWCCLHQWHQSSPESPPISLLIKNGTNNIIYTNILSGTYKTGSNNKSFNTPEKTIVLGKWYHFRYEWLIDPGTTNSYCTIWISDTRIGDQLTDADLWYNYRGPIGYTLVGKPASEMDPLSRNIREQQGIYQNTYIDPKAFHALVYDNVKIYQK